MEPLRVLYVMGYGRSGSTLLDTLLGNHPQVESVGELANLHRARSNGEYCACGSRTLECPFWSEVWRRWQEELGESPDRYATLQRRHERLRRMPRLLAGGWTRSIGVSEYRRWTWTLLEVLGEVSGRRVLVDSSKNPGRALALAGIREVDLRLIHLVRDCRGVAFSRSRSYARAPEMGLEQEIPAVTVASTARSWLGFNAFASLVRRLALGRPTMLLRYEDLVERPFETFDVLGEFTGLDLGPLKEKLAAGETFGFGHTVSGNRVRMTGSLKLRPDLTWVEQMPERDRRSVWRLSGLLLRRYGYER